MLAWKFHCNNCYYSWQESEQRRLSARSQVDPNKRSVWYYEPLIRDVPIRNMDRKGHYDEVKNFNSLCFRTILPCTDLQLYRTPQKDGVLEESKPPESISLLREFVSAGGLSSGDKAPLVDLKPRFDAGAVKERPWGDGHDPETGDDILSFEFLGSVEMLTRGKRKEDWSFRFGYSDGVCIDWNSLEFEVPDALLVTEEQDEEMGLWALPEVLCPPWMKGRFAYYTSELLSYDSGHASPNEQGSTRSTGPGSSGQQTPAGGGGRNKMLFARRKRLPSSYRPMPGSLLLPKGMVTPNRKATLSTLAASPVTPGSVTSTTPPFVAQSKAVPKATPVEEGSTPRRNGKPPPVAPAPSVTGPSTPSRTEASMAALKEKLAGFQAKAKAAAAASTHPAQVQARPKQHGIENQKNEGLRPLNTSPWAPPHPPSKAAASTGAFRTPTEWQQRPTPKTPPREVQASGSNSKRPVSPTRHHRAGRTDLDKRRKTDMRSKDSPRARESSPNSEISEPIEREPREVMMAVDLDISPRARLLVRNRRGGEPTISRRRSDVEVAGTMARAAAEAAYSSRTAAPMPSAPFERAGGRNFGKGLRGRERSRSPANFRLHPAQRSRTSGPRNAFDTGGPRNALDAAPIRESHHRHTHHHQEDEQEGNRPILVEKMSPESNSSDGPTPPRSFPPPPGLVPRAKGSRTSQPPKTSPPPGLIARHENRGPGGRMGGPRSMFGAAMQSVLRQSGSGGGRRR